MIRPGPCFTQINCKPHTKTKTETETKTSEKRTSVSLFSPPFIRNVTYVESKYDLEGKTYLVSEYPSSLEKKISLLKHFKAYMEDNLSKEPAFEETRQPQFVSTEVVTLKKWVRTKHAMFFRLSNRVVQVNFFDHTKMILSNGGLSLVYINKNRLSRSLYLPTDLQVFPERADVLTRLKYVRDIVDQLLQKRRT